MATKPINEYRHLEELGGSGYEIVDGEPHIKGWDIKDNLGNRIGKVHELLFNPASRKVRYLIADLEGKVFGTEDRRILIPIGLAELHITESDVFLPHLTLAQLAAVPDYHQHILSPDDEIALRQSYSDEPVSPEFYDEKTFYEHDHYNERNFYGKHR